MLLRLERCSALALFLAGCSCSRQYAAVHVVTTDPLKGSVAVKIFDAKSGQILGDGITPTDFVITKKSGEKNPTISFFVGDRCYPTKWKIVEITKWASEKTEALQAAYINRVQIFVTEDKDCIWDIQ